MTFGKIFFRHPLISMRFSVRKIYNFELVEEATREIFFNVTHPLNRWFMYILFFLSLFYLMYVFYLRLKLWGFNLKQKKDFAALFDSLFTQRKLLEKAKTGLPHLGIYLGFIILTITTTTVFIHYDFGWEIYKGILYVVLTVLSDFFGLFVIIFCCQFIFRRYFLQEESLISKPQDLVLTAGLAILCIQGFILEGLRVAITGDPWKYYSTIGYLVALPFEGFSIQGLKNFHFINWWVHTVSVFVFFALLPYTKAFHLVAAPLNLLFRQNSNSDKKYLNLLESFETGKINKVGYQNVNDLEAKHRLDLDACTSCGRCQEVCPAFATGKPLSPKWLILALKQSLYKQYTEKKHSFLQKLDCFLVETLTLGVPERLVNSNEALMGAVRLNGKSAILGDIFDDDFFWSCTTCNACVEACPVGINHVDHIREVRRFATTMEGKPPKEAFQTLRVLQDSGLSQLSSVSKSEFFKTLGVRVLNPGDKVEYLLWVGCISCGDRRKEKILEALVKIFQYVGLDFGVLGDREACSGDPAKQLGDEATRQMLVAKNIETLKTVQFTTLVTHCPHCAYAFSVDYGLFDSEFRVKVLHHSQLIYHLVESGRLKLSNGNQTLTIHDPCYLARYLGISEEPRSVLVRVGDLKEPKRSRKKTFCCGAGGGQYFYDLKIGERVNINRSKELNELKPDVVITMCPFCNQMISDGKGLISANFEVKDLAEVVAESLPS